MKVEVSCPDCNRLWRVDHTAGGEMLCPACMTRIPLDGTTTVRTVEEEATTASPIEGDVRRDLPTDGTRAVAAPVGSAAGTAAGRPAPAEAVGTPGAARGTTASPEWMYETVVCPRCQLHFQPRRRPTPRDVDRKTVLVVDDLAYFREIAKDALQPTFDVKTATTRDEARETLRAGGIDLLVLDLTLEGRDAGRDLLAEIQPKPCPILIFTAEDESEMYGDNWEELRRLGADDLVIKGMRAPESLARKASALLGVPVDDEETIG